MLILYLVVILFIFLVALDRLLKNEQFEKIPGPSGLFLVNNTLDVIREPVRLIRYLTHLSSKYKDIFKLRVGLKNVVIISNPDDVQALINGSKYNGKGFVYDFSRPWLGDGLLLSDGVKWHQRRKILTPAFHFNILKNFYSILLDNSEIVLDRIETEVSQPRTEILDIVSDYTLRSICETAMGTKLDEETTGFGITYKNSLSSLGTLSVLRAQRVWQYSDLIYNLTSRGQEFHSTLKTTHEFRDKVVNRRIDDLCSKNIIRFDDDEDNDRVEIYGKKKLAMLDLLLEAEKRGTIDRSGINEEVDTFMFEDKIVEECNAILGSSDALPTMNDLTQMKYLDCCIKESLRMYPPVFFISRTSDGPIKLNDYECPKRTDVSIALRELHLRSDQFVEPYKYNPDRFLQEPTSKVCYDGDEVSRLHGATPISIRMFIVYLIIIFVLLVILDRLLKNAQFEKIPGPRGFFLVNNTLEVIREPGRLKVGHKNIVIIYNPDDAEALINGTRYNGKGYLYGFIRPLLGDGLLLSDGEKWHHRRKILTPAFHFNILKNFYSILLENSEKLLERIEPEVSQPNTGILDIVSDYTLRSICETAMGTKLDEETTDFGITYKNCLSSLGSLSVRRGQRVWQYSDLIYYLTSLGQEFLSLLYITRKFRDDVIDKRIEDLCSKNIKRFDHEDDDVFVVNGKKKLAMLDLLLEAEKNGIIDRSGINDEVDTFMFEGHDTTATALQFTFMILANHQDIQNKIVEECNAILGSSDALPTMKDLTQMKYLDCCIKESLRMYPPVFFISRTSDGPIKLKVTNSWSRTSTTRIGSCRSRPGISLPIYRLVLVPGIVSLILVLVQLFNLGREWASTFNGIYSFYVYPNGSVNIYNPKDVEVRTKWHTRRKILTPAFHFNILFKFFPILVENSETFLDALDKTEGKIIDIVPFISDCTLNAICETAMGTRLDNSSSGYEYKKAITGLAHILYKRFTNVFYHSNFIFNTTKLKLKHDEYISTMHKFTYNVISRRRIHIQNKEIESDHADAGDNDKFMYKKKRAAMLDLLIAAEKEGLIDEGGIHEEVDTFMFEGHDTTSAGLTFCFLMLAEHSDVQDRIFDELESIYGDSSRRPTMEDLSKMQYLECCIKESLRLYPPVPFISRRLTEPVKLSQKFAMMELKSIVSAVLRKFKLVPVTRSTDLKFNADFILRNSGPINLIIRTLLYNNSATMFITILLLIILLVILLHYVINCNRIALLLRSIPGLKDHFLIGNIFEFRFDTPEELFRMTREWAKEFNGIYRIYAFNTGSLNIYNPDDIEILISGMKHHKKSFIYSFLRPWLRDGLLLSHGEKWQKRRKILTRAFHFNILRKYFPIIVENNQKLISVLEANEGNIIDVVPVLSEYTLDTICCTAMGAQTFEESSHAGRKYKEAIYSSVKIEREKCNDDNSDDGDEDNHVYSKKRRAAMLDLLLTAEKDGLIDNIGIQEEVDTFMFEGHDTSAAGLTFCLLALAENETIQDKIVQELDEIFDGDNRDATLEDLAAMNYLERCIKESLRLYPPVPFIGRDLSEDVKLSNYLAPKGFMSHIHIFDLHRQESLFKNALLFDPDRIIPITKSAEVIFATDLVLRSSNPILLKFIKRC
ncbi:unnamed protein product [Leptidea sinapis]|uniref:Cytochrome P450 n=1 Tax=Leptidea sinapis TaxID=189913 RepID=A0A5E4Q7T7_9NEOP|nr:unnamed protein product [Leptidea sinapis]